MATGLADAQAGNGCTSNTHDFDGWQNRGGPGALTSGQAVEGSEAQITTQDAHVCDGDFSIGWSMIAEPNSPGGDYAQSGFYDHVNNSYPAEFFAEDEYDNQPYRRTFYTFTDQGEVHNYKSAWDRSKAAIDESVDSTVIQTTNFNPYQYWGNGSIYWASEFFGELYHQPTDMPGTSSDYTLFQNIELQRYDNNAFSTDTSSLSYYDTDSSRYYDSSSILNNNGNHSFKIYTIHPY